MRRCDPAALFAALDLDGSDTLELSELEAGLEVLPLPRSFGALHRGFRFLNLKVFAGFRFISSCHSHSQSFSTLHREFCFLNLKVFDGFRFLSNRTNASSWSPPKQQARYGE